MSARLLIYRERCAPRGFRVFEADRLRHLVERDVLVVTGLGLGRGREEREGELLGFSKTRGKSEAADRARLLVVLEARSGEISAHHTLDGQRIGLSHDHRAALENRRMRPERSREVLDVRGDDVVRDRTLEELEPEERELIEDPALVGNPLGKHHVEGRQPVGGDDQKLRAEVIDVAHLAAAQEREVYGRGGERFPHGRAS